MSGHAQVPSNVILVRVGAPTWLSVIVIAWGLVATSFALMRTRLQFYVLRMLLGVAEAGSFPGMWYHLSLFYSEKDLGLAYAYVTLGGAIAQVPACYPARHSHRDEVVLAHEQHSVGRGVVHGGQAGAILGGNVLGCTCVYCNHGRWL